MTQKESSIISSCISAVVKKYSIPREDVISASNRVFYNKAKTEDTTDNVVFTIKGFIKFVIFLNSDGVKLKAYKIERKNGEYLDTPITDDKISEAIANRVISTGGVALPELDLLVK